MKKIIILLLIAFVANAQNQISIIPKPQKVIVGTGNFLINKNTKIVIKGIQNEITPIAEQLAIKTKGVYDLPLQFASKPINNYIEFSLNTTLPNEGYEIDINKSFIKISAANGVGFFYGLQSLFQLMPPQIYGFSKIKANNIAVPICKISDSPRFIYRGLMLDVSRHFFNVDFVKRMIDIMAIHKMNVFHWHLTDDQGWRIEIKKYPKLTDIGSKRKQTVVGKNQKNVYDGIPYGGYYTQEQIKEVVAYAQKKFVTIVPEIEMPGHSLAAIAAYPELGCTEFQLEVGQKWGVETDVLCPTETTFEFMENVLSEVMDLFPGKYIHIGGDECPKKAWKESSYCQDLMKVEGLKDEHELQSFFIKRIDKFITSKGRRMIGWDEILEGGLSPNATVMSWRGIDGGIQAAKMNHDVVMSPNSHLYLDYYQGKPEDEKLGVGGIVTLDKTYSYEPIPAILNAFEEKHILGLQANLWTEYVTSPTEAEYMIFPRAIASAEVGWSDKTKNYLDFRTRLEKDFARLNILAVNFAKSAYALKFKTVVEKNIPKIEVLSELLNSTIRYTTDGTKPERGTVKYNNATKIPFTNDQNVSAVMYLNDTLSAGQISTGTYIFSKSIGNTYKCGVSPNPSYLGQQEYALTDGVRGNEFSYLPWVGFKYTDMDVVIDMKQKISFERIGIAFLNNPGDHILAPENLEILVSNDGINFISVKNMNLGTNIENLKFVKQMNVSIEKQEARYVKILAKSTKMAANSSRPGQSSWIFCDEISVK